MSEPLQDLGRQACAPHDHKVLARICRNRGITMQELIREIISAHVQRVIHDAKVVLGQDDVDVMSTDSLRNRTEDHGSSRSSRR